MSNTVSRRQRDPFFREFDNLVRAAFGPSTSTGSGRTLSRSTPSGSASGLSFSPAAEAHREGDDAVIRLELPGVSTDDVTVEVKGRHLVISGSRRDQREEQGEGRRFSEFRYGSFTRSFRLSPSVTAEAVSASYDAGVLTVRVAGAYAETEGHRIEISTGAAESIDGERAQD
ncbi:MAG TPA: Hsp20/alpha crystallin family protein [Nocardioides sp.]|uniref:Hsp20/alpha crystallin family protein n=1 Tax=Nocardioides sp. TaxID=35761 RepID=UPI002F428508